MDRDSRALGHAGSRAGNKKVDVPGPYRGLPNIRGEFRENAPAWAPTELDYISSAPVRKCTGGAIRGLPHWESIEYRVHHYPKNRPLFPAAFCTDLKFDTTGLGEI